MSGATDMPSAAASMRRSNSTRSPFLQVRLDCPPSGSARPRPLSVRVVQTGRITSALSDLSGRQQQNGGIMAATFSTDERREHFAYCVQLFGGTTAFSRRLGIDERAIRRFISGERPLGAGLLEDTAKALRLLIAEATAAEGQIAATLSSGPKDPS